MRKFRKLIGVILAQADGPYQSKLMKGILSEAFKLNYDVAVFSPFVKDKLSDVWHIGETNIYSLINYSVFDGIIFLPDMLKVDNVCKQVEEDIKKNYNKPVVSVDLETKGFTNLFTDDIQNIKKIVSHLIEVHKLTDIAFMTGIKGHPHSTNRLTGYYEAMIEHNLPIDQSRVFYGDFWYDEGENVVSALMNDGRPMPQAIACACDTMAVSVCEALKARGIKIPEDIAVTGYDSVETGINYVPSITSSDIPAENTGTRAVKLLHSLISGTKFVDDPCGAEISIAKSCGCSVNLAEKRRSQTGSWHDEDYYGEFDSTYNFMLDDLISEKDYENYLRMVCRYTYYLGKFDSFHLCICENWDNLGENELDPNYLVKGYSPRMCKAIYRHGDDAHVNPDETFDTAEMLPALYERRPNPTAFYFTPVHFNDRCFGYSVINYGSETISYSSTYRKWMRYVCSSMESLRRQRNLHFMYKKMEENAVTDLLTGIYSRNGFNLYADELFDEARRENKKFTVIVGDMNNLKYINDSFGHIEGDFAIKSVADAFRHASSEKMMCFRIGGDEFVIVSKDVTSETEISVAVNKINAYLKNVNDTADKPYSVSVSIGVLFDNVENLETIEHALSAADEKMFAAKEKYKREEGFDYRKSHH